MRSIKSFKDVVDWGLCIGCGACYFALGEDTVSLINVESSGIKPFFRKGQSRGTIDALPVCPGYAVDARELASAERGESGAGDSLLIGPTLEIWEGYAADEEIRYRASSGGALTALSLYCLEQENMSFLLHTGMNPSKPWENMTVRSKNRGDLLMRSGSRYSPSSPCDSLRMIEESGGRCVFLGKPCDASSVSVLLKMRPRLNENLGLILTFFCAGTPNTNSSKDLIGGLGIELKAVKSVKYRGNGWPGNFQVLFDEELHEKTLTYKESWGYLAGHRPFRCLICPDGLGEVADISCGDAWHLYSENDDPGRSIVLIRTERGREIFHKALSAGYLEMTASDSKSVLTAQGLVQRRMELFGRLLAMKILFVPTPKYRGFYLYRSWVQNSLLKKMKVILGTVRRLIRRRMYRRNDPFKR